jgi:diguanylate cyclase (GGDEF)-like protein
MWVPVLESAIELVNAAFALGILFLGYRALGTIQLPMYRRSTRFFVLACGILAVLELAGELKPLASDPSVVSLAREIMETVFLITFGTAVYLLGHSGRFEVNALKRSADSDELTGLRNAAYFRRVGQRRFDEAKKHGAGLALVLFDIDDFKAYNDAFGHPAGDVALRRVAQVFAESTRESDLIARYGGEEFVALITPPPEGADLLAERVRANIEARCRPEADATLKRALTISCGVTLLSQDQPTLEDFVHAADREMYRAKTAGKNGVSVGASGAAQLRGA